MSDIVKRLYEEAQEVTDSLYYQAAETIEELKEELQVLDELEIARWQTIQMQYKRVAELETDNAQLRYQISAVQVEASRLRNGIPKARKESDWMDDYEKGCVEGWNDYREELTDILFDIDSL